MLMNIEVRTLKKLELMIEKGVIDKVMNTQKNTEKDTLISAGRIGWLVMQSNQKGYISCRARFAEQPKKFTHTMTTMPSL
jgi:hypothetical protein